MEYFSSYNKFILIPNIAVEKIIIFYSVQVIRSLEVSPSKQIKLSSQGNILSLPLSALPKKLSAAGSLRG